MAIIKKGTTNASISESNFVNYAAFDSASISKAFSTVEANTAKIANQSTKTNLVYTSTLKAQPTIFSASQFDLNDLRINKITEAAKNVLRNPAIDSQPYRFGVLEQIRPEIQEYKKAYRGVSGLITTLQSLFDPAEAAYIQAEFEGIGRAKAYDTVIKEAEEQVRSEYAENDGVPDPDAENERYKEYQNQLAVRETALIYEEFYNMGKLVVKLIAYMEARYTKIESKMENKLRARIQKEDQIEKLNRRIALETDKLAGLETRRVEILGDYGVAQRLLEDDWKNIYEKNIKRAKVLTEGVRGLYYVRVRQAPISMPLADPLSLRYGKASDIVPGCDWQEDVDIPDELDDFFDTVLEVPMSDWAGLKSFTYYLPVDKRIDYISQLRSARFKTKPALNYKTAIFSRPVQTRLFAVRTQSRSVIENLSRYTLPLYRGSVKVFQQEAAKVMSLEDLLGSTRGVLCKEAQTMRDRLEQCVACMLEHLNELPPSIRLQWAQLAEDDRIVVNTVNKWPGLERAEADDFNATRTLSELVDWWFRQLDGGASASGQSAMRNMIRAILIYSALGDPSEIVQGEVQVPPRKLDIGESLRLRLNRMPKPGTVLQLLDPQQKIIALLNIDDHDEQGTLANITHVNQKNAIINTNYRVVASKLTKQLKY